MSTLTLLFIFVVAATIESAVTVTWSVNITRMTTELVAEELPSITQTSDGTIWVVWAKAVLGDRTLYCKNSSDLGTTWSEEKNLTYIPIDAVGHDTSPSIIQAANGTIWLVWTSNRPPPFPHGPDFSIDASPESLVIPQGDSDTSTVIITSLQNFSEPVNLLAKTGATGVDTSFDPNPVTPPQDGSANSTLTVSVDMAAELGNHTLIVLGNSENKSHSTIISLEITNSSMATLNEAYSSTSSSAAGDETDYEIYYKTSNDNGATWSNRFQLTNTDNTIDDLRPSIVQLMNGTIMVVRQSTTQPGAPESFSDIFYSVTSDGISWISSNITADPGSDKTPSIMQAEDGRIWVAWASDRTGNDEIFCKNYDGLSWSNATMVTNSTMIDVCPSLLQTIDGTIWLFWQSTQDKPTLPPGDIYYKFSTDNGATWSDRIQFTTDNNNDKWAAITQTYDTKIWVAWASNRADQPDGNWDIYLKASLAGDVTGPDGYPDGVVDIYDLSLVAKAYGSMVGEPGYDLELDITKDGRIDIRDLAIVCRNYGET